VRAFDAREAVAARCGRVELLDINLLLKARRALDDA